MEIASHYKEPKDKEQTLFVSGYTTLFKLEWHIKGGRTNSLSGFNHLDLTPNLIRDRENESYNYIEADNNQLIRLYTEIVGNLYAEKPIGLSPAGLQFNEKFFCKNAGYDALPYGLIDPDQWEFHR